MSGYFQIANGCIKICGVTSAEDALGVARAGASAIGFNLWPGSSRYVSLARAVELAKPIRDELFVVAVGVDLGSHEIEMIRKYLSPNAIQVHQAAGMNLVEGDDVYYGVGLGDEADCDAALRSPGTTVLVDAKDDVLRGGTGRRAPLDLMRAVCAARPTLVAGGLNSTNVGSVIHNCMPWGVDVASGVENRPGEKSFSMMCRFVESARTAFNKQEKENV